MVRRIFWPLVLSAVLGVSLFSSPTATAESGSVTGVTMWMSSDQLALSLHEPSLANLDPTDSAGMARAMSQAQAAARAQRGIAAPNNVPGGGGGGPWYQILLDQHDWAGNDTPTRNGDYSNFGYLKGTVAHNLFTLSAYRAAYSGYPKGSSGGNRLYIAWLVVQGYPRLQVNFAASPSTSSMYGQTPDRKPVGTVTGYCVGFTYCPDYVNSV